MQVKRVLRTGGIVLVVLVCLGGAGLGALLLHIHASTGRYCSMAQAAHPYPGDDVASLIDFMKSDTHSLRKRNLAVWTLGRLRDSAALPALESFYTAEECDHETQLCQGELYKAIALCGGTPHPRHERKPETVEQEE
ncbi:MAG: hypothetical protein JW741_08565 [Sedimentisphaerales bacterium]|nr:hypothetical protein [Sedimentisphaerales bacterium]